MNDSLNHYLQEYERNRSLMTGDALAGVRHSAMHQFQELGFPTRREENWKYTDVRKLLKHNFRFNNRLPELSPDRINGLRFNDPSCHELVFINGIFSPQHSNISEPDEHIIISDLGSALAERGELIDEHITRYSGTDSTGFKALNTAFLQQGSLIAIPDNAIVTKPVHLLHLGTQQELPFTSQTRNLVVLGDNATATIIESFIGLDDAVYFTNTVSEIRLNPGSRLVHYRIQQESNNSFHLGHTSIQQENDSHYASHVISMGAELSRTDLNCRLQAPGAEVILNGLYMVDGNQHTDHHILIDHLVPATTSTQNYRGILDNKGRAVFNGKVVVHKGADKTDAQQSNANLLLSDDAEIDTKPELEIYADDVKCSHGATVGQLDQQMLFYLRSRAIDEKTARSLLTFAFADEVIREIGIKAIRDRLEHLVVGQLPDSDLIREFTNE